MANSVTKKKSLSGNKQSAFSKTLSSVKKSVENMTAPNNNVKSNDTMLRKFFIDTLKDTYWAENHLVKALPKMEKAASSKELKTAFADHLKVTQTHVKRLDHVFKALGETPRGKKCEAMQGLVEEGKSIIASTKSGTATRDVGLIIAGQKVEHYEIAAYGGLAQLARTLGEEKAQELLEMTLKEEKETDALLTHIAVNDVNYEAFEEA